MSDQETSGSGSPIYRHQARERDWSLPENPGRNLEEIQAHLEEHLGPVDGVFHELLSDKIHLDVLFVPPTEDKPFHTLVTSGVSDLPMTTPPEMEEFQFAELMIHLPPDWPLDQESFQNENNYWPVRWLKQIGRLPHDYSTWIGWGHTIPNGDPPSPIANTRFTGVMLAPAYWLPTEFFQLETQAGETICFYEMAPLYQEEMDLKLHQGAEALEELFEKHEISPVVDVDRKNVAKKRGWFG